jgi:putative CocE/NonD family hydrolase
LKIVEVDHVQESYASRDVVTEFNLATRMRDGIRLSTDVYRPRDSGRWPTVLIRTPYDNNDTKLVDFGKKFAAWGYAVATQDVRGRYDSEGEWYPSKNEGRDGYDALKWLNHQKWCNGKVGMTGGSYNAMVQWDVAVLRPPNLKAMVSMVCPSDLFVNCWYRQGTLGWGDTLRWLVTVDARVNQNLVAYNMRDVYWHVPFKTADEALGRHVAFWRDWMSHQSYDSYWKASSYHHRYHSVGVPVLHISGWYDDCADGNIRNYLSMKKQGRTAQARNNQYLVMGPWAHRINDSRRYGELDFGPSALVDLDRLQKRWFDHWLKGESNGIIKESHVSIFLMGRNQWREERDWPLRRAKVTKFYFHSKGHANSFLGDGRLTTKAPSREPADDFDYDPDNPCPSPVNVNEPDDRRIAERRDDVLVYDSRILAGPIEVTGNVLVELFAKSSAPNTDFAAHLVDVYDNGYAHPVADGIVTARYRQSIERPTNIIPEKTYRYRIDLWHTGNVFLKGHRMRVEISSADFPRYARNMNTGRPYGADLKGKVAHQEVLHSASDASNILLPIIA